MPIPVRFVATDAGNYVIWDNGGKIGDRGLPYAEAGTIERSGHGWVLHRQGRVPVDSIPNVGEAKRLYLIERAIPVDPSQCIAASEPASPTCTVQVGMGEWERVGDWRAQVFAALVRRNSPATVTVMLTPVASDEATRQYTLRLPVPVAESLLQRLQRDY